jgi:ribosome-binding protein aMBF1 (putative translation factor)
MTITDPAQDATTAPHAPAGPGITEDVYEAPYEDLGTVLAMLPYYVRAARTRRGWSMRDLAAHLGVSVSTVHRIETKPSPVPLWLGPMLRWLGEQDADQ